MRVLVACEFRRIATNQSVAAIDFPFQNASTATRLHWFVIRLGAKNG